MENNESTLMTLWKSFHSGPHKMGKRSEEMRLTRRSTRNSVAISMRNIGVLTPINSPCPTPQKNEPKVKTKNTPKKVVGQDKSKIQPRAELLKKWQMEKNKRKELEKIKNKPVFKVPHISSTSTYNLDQVYNEIKGKSIESLLRKDSKNTLRPIESHKFKAPSNIKRLAMKLDNQMKTQKKQNLTTDKYNFQVEGRSLRSKAVKVNLKETKKSNIKEEKPLTPSKEDKQNVNKRKLNFKTPVDQAKSKTDEVAKSSQMKPPKALIKEELLQETENGARSSKRQTPQNSRKSLFNEKPLQQIDSVAGCSKKQTPRNTRKSLFNEKPLQQINNTTEISKEKTPRTTPKLLYKEKSLLHTAKENSTNSSEVNLINAVTNQLQSTTLQDSYYSPRVTRCRGKENAQKQYQNKVSKSAQLAIANTSYVTTTELANTSSIESNLPQASTTPVSESIYISPFVTTSRGKDNARREYHNRMSPLNEQLNKSSSPQAAARYFTKLLRTETERLTSLCDKWNSYKLENTTEEVGDMIAVAVGQTELLINKKFKQFVGLIKCCETGESEKPVTCLDLHGFWDTLILQVHNLDKRFQYLDQLKENDWEEIIDAPKVTKKAKAKRAAPKKAAASSSLKAMIEARRKKLKEAPSTPGSSKKTPSKRTTRVSIVASESKRRLSSPGLTIMKVTQAAKSAEQSTCTTPVDKMISVKQPKSILKSEPRRQSLRKSKAVLFKESPVFQTENDVNLPNVDSSPVRIVDKSLRRRSSRLSTNK